MTSEEKPERNEIEVIDLTEEDNIIINSDRLDYFCERMCLAFKNRKNLMSLLRLKKLVNKDNIKKFADIEINSALVDAHQVTVFNDVVYLI